MKWIKELFCCGDCNHAIALRIENQQIKKTNNELEGARLDISRRMNWLEVDYYEKIELSRKQLLETVERYEKLLKVKFPK